MSQNQTKMLHSCQQASHSLKPAWGGGLAHHQELPYKRLTAKSSQLQCGLIYKYARTPPSYACVQIRSLTFSIFLVSAQGRLTLLRNTSKECNMVRIHFLCSPRRLSVLRCGQLTGTVTGEWVRGALVWKRIYILFTQKVGCSCAVLAALQTLYCHLCMSAIANCFAVLHCSYSNLLLDDSDK